MKNFYLPIFALLLLLNSCGSDSKQKNSESALEESINSVIQILDTEDSEIKWERHLHEGPTKKKVKLFGADVDIEMGEVNLTTNGEAKLSSGSLELIDDEISSVILVFDMKTFKINTEMNDKKDDLFKTKEYPKSELTFSEIKKTADGYILNGELKIAETIKPVSCTAVINSSENTTTLEGNMAINTLDFPLRDEEAKKNTIEDVVNVELLLHFKN